MPTYITREQFSCGHATETRRAVDSEEPSIAETTTVPERCLACVCRSLLEPPPGGLGAVPRSSLRELEGHHSRALARHPMAEACGLAGLVDSALRPRDAVEFRRAVTALAGFPEFAARFGGGCREC